MTTDEALLTPAERRSAEELRTALHDIAAAQPIRLDSGAVTAVARTRRFGTHLPLGLVAALAIVVIAASALVAWPRQTPGGPTASPSAVATLPGTPGHYIDAGLSFDYPPDWPVISGTDNGAEGVMYVLAVVGNGSWSESCQSGSQGSSSWMNCGADIVTVPSGGIVVKVYRWYGGPAVPCRGDTQANATFGPNAVRETVNGDVTSWEIRAPGNEFGQPNNIFVEAHTSDAKQLARAQALVTSFRFKPIQDGSIGCPSMSPDALTPAS
jgi:hypothetical protein